MKNRILLKTNLMVCAVIVAGFLLTAIFSYRLNYNESLDSIEQVSNLTSEGIYYQMNTILSKPVNISLTMANDSLLKSFLIQEPERMDDPAYIETLREYLLAYQAKYGYDSVFLVSAASARYYNFNGLDRVLVRGDPENVWYYDVLLPSDAEYAMNVDNDEVKNAENAITLFVNCKIFAEDKTLLGVVGVGVRIDQLQGILQGYQEEFGVNAYFIDEEGTIELSADVTGYEHVSLFDTQAEIDAKDDILNWKTDGTPLSFWDLDGTGQKRDYIVARYLPEIGWRLVVERDTSELMQTLNRQMAVTVLIILAIIGTILYIITHVIQSFNRQIVSLERTYERERKTMFEKATEQLFEDIYELDVTNNRPANRVTEKYFESLGAPAGTPFDKALAIIANKQIMPEFRHGYLETFSTKNVLEAFSRGVETLSYDFMITTDGEHYYWMRITARLLRLASDGTLHMLTYRQNIDAEKRREEKMQLLARTDEMTGLLNKTAAQRAVEERLLREPDRMFAFFIFDIDDFKEANDLYGHAFGDKVIRAFAETMRTHFRCDDLLGRIGGDEFIAFLPVPDREWAARKARELNLALGRDYIDGACSWHMSASIGVAFSPLDGSSCDSLYRRADAALYETKRRGRGGFTLIKVNASISGTTANVSAIDTSKVGAENRTITIDLTGLDKTINKVSLPTKSVDALVGAGAEGLTLKLTTGTVEFDARALAAINDAADGSTVSLEVKETAASALTADQKASIDDLDNAVVVNINMVSNGKVISDFKGGQAAVTVPYELKPGQDPDSVTVYYLDSDGKLTAMETSYDARTGTVTFIAPHFSSYVVTSEYALPFVDVQEDDWFCEAVRLMYEKGLMSGTSATTFSPDATTTRGMIVTILYRLEGIPSVSGEGAAFTDVPYGEYYTDAVTWASANGVVKGYSDGRFGPDDPITREQMAAILYRYAQVKGYNLNSDGDLSVFTDQPSDWAAEAMKWAVGKGIVTGIGGGKLDPTGSATRAQVAVMLQRCLVA